VSDSQENRNSKTAGLDSEMTRVELAGQISKDFIGMVIDRDQAPIKNGSIGNVET
jgi:hypothetical protein